MNKKTLLVQTMTTTNYTNTPSYLLTFLLLVLASSATNPVLGFVSSPKHSISPLSIGTSTHQKLNGALTALHSQPPNNNNNEYSRDVRLREEAESPFRKVRFFLYLTLGGGAMTSLLLSVTRIAAASSGINADLMQESLINAGVDFAGLVVLGFFFQRDSQAQETRLKRATKGASLAKLAIRVHKGIQDPLFAADSDNSNSSPGDDPQKNTFTSLTLADLRRDRGIEKRVVIAAAGKDKIQQVLEETKTYASALEMSDLLVVPVVMPMATAPEIVDISPLPTCVALPVGNSAWRTVLEDESQSALQQDVDIETEGFCVILKKNGRVGQRTRGIFLERMVGEVEERREMGMDVTNI